MLTLEPRRHRVTSAAASGCGDGDGARGSDSVRDNSGVGGHPLRSGWGLLHGHVDERIDEPRGIGGTHRTLTSHEVRGLWHTDGRVILQQSAALVRDRGDVIQLTHTLAVQQAEMSALRQVWTLEGCARPTTIHGARHTTPEQEQARDVDHDAEAQTVRMEWSLLYRDETGDDTRVAQDTFG